MDTTDQNKLIEAARSALIWMQSNHLPKAGDAWGASVKERLEKALYYTPSEVQARRIERLAGTDLERDL